MSDQKYSDDDLRRVAGIKDEQFNDQIAVVLEVLDDVQQKVALIPQIQEDISELKQDMRVVKAAVTDTNHELHALDTRVTRLEAAA